MCNLTSPLCDSMPWSSLRTTDLIHRTPIGLPIGLLDLDTASERSIQKAFIKPLDSNDKNIPDLDLFDHLFFSLKRMLIPSKFHVEQWRLFSLWRD